MQSCQAYLSSSAVRSPRHWHFFLTGHLGFRGDLDRAIASLPRHVAANFSSHRQATDRGAIEVLAALDSHYTDQVRKGGGPRQLLHGSGVKGEERGHLTGPWGRTSHVCLSEARARQEDDNIQALPNSPGPFFLKTEPNVLSLSLLHSM